MTKINPTLLFAFLDPAQIGVFIPIIIFMIPIVAILTKHQQRMAEIFRDQKQPNAEVQDLRRELAEMRSMMVQQTLALDNLSNRVLESRSVEYKQLQ